MVTITQLLPEFWLPKIFSTRHGDQNGCSLERWKGIPFTYEELNLFLLEATTGNATEMPVSSL